MKNHIRWTLTALVSVTVLLSVGATAYAVDPGWGTPSGDIDSNTNNSYDITPPVNEHPSNSGNHYGGIVAPSIGGGHAGSLGGYDNSNGSSGGYVDRDNNSNDNQNNNDDSNNNNNQSNQNSQNNNSSSASSVSSTSSSSSSFSSSSHELSKPKEKPESRSKLRKFAKKTYKEQMAVLKNQNKQRVVVNNQKGAVQLHDAYLARKKEIKSGKIDKQTHDKYVEQQRSALQQALSQRLATLQTDYDNGQKSVKSQVKALDDTHKSDAQAMNLSDALANLDYQLGVKSNRAYTRYNRSVNELLAQTSQVKHGERSKQYAQAKSDYQDNLNAVDAVDPGTLRKQNKQRVKDLKSIYSQVQMDIDNGNIQHEDQIVKKLVG